MKTCISFVKATPFPLKIFYFVALLLSVAPLVSAEPLDIAMCAVGNAGNAADPVNGNGAVSYEFNIAKYPITVAQYTEFLNAVAKADKYRVYIPNMTQVGRAVPASNQDDPTDYWPYGIARSGDSGEYTYSVIGTSGSLPMLYVSWFNAARFCNWLQNGQPADLGEAAGSTETGAYTLNGDYRKGGETREQGAKWWLPSGNEWYKAAFYDPRLNKSAGGYWKFATQSNKVPGNTVGGGKNEVNAISNAQFAVKGGSQSNKSLFPPVGSFPNSLSYYGCLDMSDQCQWTDTIARGDPRWRDSGGRVIVGGSPNVFTYELQSSTIRFDVGGYPDSQVSWDTGIRIAKRAN
jgi:formylglycine-generating enzyme required for sulfatase activity